MRRGRPKLTFPERQRLYGPVVRALKRGKTLEDVATEYGVTRQRVSQWARCLGYKPRGVSKMHLLPAFRRLLRSGVLPWIAAKSLGICSQTAVEWKHRFKIKRWLHCEICRHPFTPKSNSVLCARCQIHSRVWVLLKCYTGRNLAVALAFVAYLRRKRNQKNKTSAHRESLKSADNPEAR